LTISIGVESKTGIEPKFREQKPVNEVSQSFSLAGKKKKKKIASDRFLSRYFPPSIPAKAIFCRYAFKTMGLLM
jgi:hypothetical protein